MKKILNINLSIMAVLFFVACEGILEEDPPGAISLASFYQGEDDATIGLYGAYSNMYGIASNTYLNYGEMNADNMVISPIVTDQFSWDYFTYNNEVTNGLWSNCFSGINRANEVIAYTPKIDFNDEGKKADIIAEAKAVRAFYYFQMVRTMGGVPIYETPTVGFDEIYRGRATEDEVYELIIRDFKEAASELEPASPGGRINSNVADAMLARIYLYRGDYSNALTHAQNVISSGEYELFPDFADVFDPANDNGIEHIFQIQYLSGERNNGVPTSCAPRPSVGEYQNSFFAQTVPGGSRAPSADFVADNPDSYRKWQTVADHYEHIDGVTGTITMEEAYEGNFPYYICKFDDREAEIASGLNFTILRYADILLIAAEALNEVDPDDIQKYTWINQIRARARNGVESDLPDLSGLTQDEFREAVLEERRFELAFEGQRAWDLKRRGKFLEKLRAQGRNVEDYMLLFPIPDDQTKLNPNLEQNLGW